MHTSEALNRRTLSDNNHPWRTPVYYQTHSSCFHTAGSSTIICIPTSIMPPTSTVLITPALRLTIFRWSSLSRNRSCKPERKWLICGHGFRRPVTTKIGWSLLLSRSIDSVACIVGDRKCNFVPCPKPNNPSPVVVIFSPRSPGAMSISFSISRSRRCTWRKFLGGGLMCSLERCWTVSPQWLSPSTPRFGSSVKEVADCFEKE